MNEFQLHGLLRGVLVPGFVSGVIYLAARLAPLSLRESLRNGGALAGFVASYILLVGLPHWPLTGSPNGLWSAIVIVAIWPTLEQFIDRRVWFKRYLAIAIVSLAILRPLVDGLWSLSDTTTHIVFIAAGATLVWYLLERGLERMRPAAVTGSCVVLGAGAAAMMFFEGSALLAQMTGAWCAILGAVTFLSLWQWLKPSRELLPFTVILGSGLVTAHVFYVNSSWNNWLWICLPLLWFVGRGMVKNSWSAKKDLAFSVLIMALPVAIGVFRAFGRWSADGAGY